MTSEASAPLETDLKLFEFEDAASETQRHNKTKPVLHKLIIDPQSLLNSSTGENLADFPIPLGYNIPPPPHSSSSSSSVRQENMRRSC